MLDRCRRGDRSAFGLLVSEHQDRVFNLCWRMAGNRADAEDLTQETFVRALQSIDRFDGRSRFYTWVFRIAVNLAISARRKGGRTVVRSLEDGRQGEDDGRSTSFADGLAAPGESPEERLTDRERESVVAEALAELDGDHRAVVILRDLESLGYDQIADVLNIPAGTVKSRLHRARLALREKLSPLLDEA